MSPRVQNHKPGYKIRKTEDTKSLTSRPKIINGTLRHIYRTNYHCLSKTRNNMVNLIRLARDKIQ